MNKSKTETRYVCVNPMTAAEGSIRFAKRKDAKSAWENMPSQWVVMTERQWIKYLAQCQRPGITEPEQRALVSKIVGYDY
ncbi:hypothetical protein GCM10011378_41230 [Hymenobacter glacieicola]|uniref:Uncharacterized protein n=1 Tax=Hymenobacter glacieicola TaxID=1562124 RepID=A0ABQ1X5J9_9BACT|nr:hypothetical protein GCM10011378_41230 [Hymenobacter glacieicola]